MARTSKCVTCKVSFPTEELTVKAGKKYCSTCLKIKEDTPKVAKVKNSDWDLLFRCICEIYNISVPTGMMFMQLKQFRGDEYKYTDIGMYYTLKYYYETLENEVKEGTGLGIIPYYYEKAKLHFSKVYDIQDIADEVQLNHKVINIKTAKYEKPIKKMKPLTLESVRKEDDECEDID